MKTKFYIVNSLLALGIALAVFVARPASFGKAEWDSADKLPCASGCDASQTASSVPAVSSIVLAGPNPTNADNVEFKVTFSEPVAGVDISDFAPVVQGVGFVLVTDVHGSGSTYSVSVYTGYGNGTLSLDVVDNDTIKNESGETLGGIGLYNGDFTSGETYTINR